jgi:hypothetical protein
MTLQLKKYKQTVITLPHINRDARLFNGEKVSRLEIKSMPLTVSEDGIMQQSLVLRSNLMGGEKFRLH